MRILKNIYQYDIFYILIAVLSLVFAFIFSNILENKSIYSFNEKNFYCKITKIRDSDFSTMYDLKCKEKLIAIYKEKNIYNIGDKVILKGNLKYPEKRKVFNLFDYKEYLKNKKIHYILEIESINLYKTNKNILYKIKQSIINKVENLENGYIKAFILADTNSLKKEVKNSYKTNGINHLFAISGMHVSLITFIILKIFKLKISFAFIILFFYMFLANFTASILRATLFFVLLSLNKKLNLNVKPTNILLMTLSIIILINPYIINEVGFQISFVVSFFLIYYKEKIKNKNKLISILLVSTIAFFSSFPIIINNFFEVNFLSIIYNLFFVPFVSILIFPISLISFFLPMFIPILDILTNILENTSLCLENIKTGIFIFGKVPFLLILLYYLLLLKNKKILLFILILFMYNKNYLNKNLEITFIDVNQGDAIFIKLPNNETILIDTGGDFFKHTKLIKDETIILYTKSLGHKKIDHLVLTHGHFDHLGNSIEILKNLKVENVYFNNNIINENEKVIIDYLKDNNINYVFLKEGETLKTRKHNITNINSENYSTENESSIVLYFDIYNTKAIFMGDVYKKQEDILAKKVKSLDIVKISHHGSNTSTSEKFIEKTKPINSIISVGSNNKFNHPSPETIELLEEINSNIFKTSVQGSIKFIINKNKKTIDIIN